MTTAVEHLVRLGLSEYEARAYIAAVALGEATVREISEESGVPRSRAYDIMERLATKGFVEVGSSSPRRYRPNPPLVVSSHLMDEMRRASDEALRELSEVRRQAEGRDTPIWTVQGEWAIDHKVAELLSSAKREVTILCLSSRSLIRYAKTLASASEQKQITVIISPLVEGFDGFLGKCRVMRLRDYPLMNEIGGALEEGGYVLSDGAYCIEVVMRSDRDITLLVTLEGDSRRAIVINGTILDFFSRTSVDFAISVAEDIDHSRSASRKGS
jgi:predicted transcriptional regulator